MNSVKVFQKSFCLSGFFYQGLQTESEVSEASRGDAAAAGRGVAAPLAYTGITGPPGVNAPLGIKKANCPSVAGTSWKPPYTLEASDGDAPDGGALLHAGTETGTGTCVAPGICTTGCPKVGGGGAGPACACAV